MGIDIIRLGGEPDLMTGPTLAPDLAELSFRTHNVTNPPMSIWMMAAATGRPLLPWWRYAVDFDSEITRLNRDWAVTSAQSLFDCLFLSQLKRIAGPNLYVIFPGNLRTEEWGELTQVDQMAFSRGQACVYHLEGAYDGKLSINWVPFFQPQSILKDPSFGTLWRLFVAARTEDTTNSISFFSLSDPKALPNVIQLLIHKDDQRSETLSRLVDWFGMYSSPITERHSACGIVYTSQREALELFAEFETKFTATMDQMRQQLAAQPVPQTAFKILSRHIAL